MFCKKGVLRNFPKFTGKHLYQSLVLTLLKKWLWHWFFSVNSVKFLRAPFFIEHLWWLALFRIIEFCQLCVISTNILATGCVLQKRFRANFAKFTGKHLCQSLFFNKVPGLWPATLLKKRLWYRCFPVNFANFFFWETPFYIEHLWWLLLVFNNLLFSSYWKRLPSKVL